MSVGVKLAIGGAVVTLVTGYMAYVGASSSWKYYLTVDECGADAARLVEERMRVSGKVAVDSLEISADRSRARFILAGQRERLEVVCSGRLPDNLAEGVGNRDMAIAQIL